MGTGSPDRLDALVWAVTRRYRLTAAGEGGQSEAAGARPLANVFRIILVTFGRDAVDITAPRTTGW